MAAADPDKILRERFGFSAFRGFQKEVIEEVLRGRDSLVLLPTGGGKSLCYQLPALALPGVTLVVSPLIALMKDQVDALRKKGIPADFWNSTLGAGEKREVAERLKTGETKLLFVAPERLVSEDFRRFLAELNEGSAGELFGRETKISLIAIDEAHCISEWGHDFRPSYRRLREIRDLFPETPIIALTATATEEVREDICRQLRFEKPAVFVASFDRPNLSFRVWRKRDAVAQLLPFLRDDEGKKSAIVYCFSRADTENLADALFANGIEARAYHAGLAAQERKETQELFLADEVPVICATIAFGMGIDKPDVRLVAHLTFPATLEAYYQQIGRAGRDGEPAECLLLFSGGDAAKHRFFLRQVENWEERQRREEALAKMIRFCEMSGCRRNFLLEHFGEKREGACGSCDNCRLKSGEPDPISEDSSDAPALKKSYFPSFSGDGGTVRESIALLEKGSSLDQVARARNLTRGTILRHIERSIVGGKVPEGIEILRQECPNFRAAERAFLELGMKALKPVFDALNGEASYEELRIARILLVASGLKEGN